MRRLGASLAVVATVVTVLSAQEPSLDVVAIYANNDLARQKLGWAPIYGIDEMMHTAWEWEQRVKADDTIFGAQAGELN